MSVVQIPRILLPARSADPDFMRKWSVIACDQFTSDRAYWKALEEEVEDSPSSLHLVFPEVYLNDGDEEERVAAIRENMQKYLREGVFRELNKGFVLVERSTPYTREKRYGVMLSIDLEEYSFQSESKAKVRATEATVPERIPPRVKIRRGAPLELPHVMLLYDAPEERILSGLKGQNLPLLYDFELNRGGGKLRGWFIGEGLSEEIIRKLYASAGEMLFAVGDGNHSLATAKTCWEEIKKNLTEKERETHPARYALCEAVSLYSPALTFEPIHRFVCGVNAEKGITELKKRLSVPVEREGNVVIPQGGDPVRILRETDAFIAEFTGMGGGKVDYVHGEDSLRALVESVDGAEKSSGKGRFGVRMNTVKKDGFFKSVEESGSFPRKTFSMGEGAEKRYYTECKAIYKDGKEN